MKRTLAGADWTSPYLDKFSIQSFSYTEITLKEKEICGLVILQLSFQIWFKWNVKAKIFKCFETIQGMQYSDMKFRNNILKLHYFVAF